MPHSRPLPSEDREPTTRAKDAAISADRYKTCDVCGETFDTHDLDAIYHHGPDPHSRLKDDPA